MLGLLATLTGRSSLMQSAFLDGQYIGPLASAFLPGGAQYSELLLSSYLQSHDSSIEGLPTSIDGAVPIPASVFTGLRGPRGSHVSCGACFMRRSRVDVEGRGRVHPFHGRGFWV